MATFDNPNGRWVKEISYDGKDSEIIWTENGVSPIEFSRSSVFSLGKTIRSNLEENSNAIWGTTPKELLDFLENVEVDCSPVLSGPELKRAYEVLT